jgi:WhiB family transcriptional regulator, redox-sensing transcriptional regulator
MRRDNETWRHHAACRDIPEEWWFPVGTTGDALQHLEAGKRICLEECPVREECLDYAIGRGEKYGTWGGMGEDERERERRNRGRRVGARDAA